MYLEKTEFFKKIFTCFFYFKWRLSKDIEQIYVRYYFKSLIVRDEYGKTWFFSVFLLFVFFYIQDIESPDWSHKFTFVLMKDDLRYFKIFCKKFGHKPILFLTGNFDIWEIFFNLCLHLPSERATQKFKKWQGVEWFFDF